MKLTDKKGKLFGKINIIDFCVIIVVIVLAVGAFYKFKVVDKTSTSVAMEPITYTVQINRVRDFVFNNIREGDLLYDKTSGNCIGTIVGFEATPAQDRLQMPDGTVIMTEVENRYDVLLTVEGEGVVNESGHFINRTYELIINSSKKFMTKYFECDGKVREIL